MTELPQVRRRNKTSAEGGGAPELSRSPSPADAAKAPGDEDGAAGY